MAYTECKNIHHRKTGVCRPNRMMPLKEGCLFHLELNEMSHDYVLLCMQNMDGPPPYCAVVFKGLNPTGFTYLTHLKTYGQNKYSHSSWVPWCTYIYELWYWLDVTPTTCLFYEMPLFTRSRHFEFFHLHCVFWSWWRPAVSCCIFPKVWMMSVCSRSHPPKSRLIVLSGEPCVWALNWHHFYPEIPSSIWTCFNTFYHVSDVWTLLVNMCYLVHGLRF